MDAARFESLVGRLEALVEDFDRIVEARASRLAELRIEEAERLAALRVEELKSEYAFDRDRWSKELDTLKKFLNGLTRRISFRLQKISEGSVDAETIQGYISEYRNLAFKNRRDNEH